MKPKYKLNTQGLEARTVKSLLYNDVTPLHVSKENTRELTESVREGKTDIELLRKYNKYMNKPELNARTELEAVTSKMERETSDHKLYVSERNNLEYEVQSVWRVNSEYMEKALVEFCSKIKSSIDKAKSCVTDAKRQTNADVTSRW